MIAAWFWPTSDRCWCYGTGFEQRQRDRIRGQVDSEPCNSASGPVVAAMLQRGTRNIAHVGPIDQGSQLAVFAIDDGRGRDRRHVFGQDRGAGLDLKMSCIRVVSVPSSARCSSDISSTAKSTFKRLALGRTSLGRFFWLAFIARGNLWFMKCGTLNTALYRRDCPRQIRTRSVLKSGPTIWKGTY